MHANREGSKTGCTVGQRGPGRVSMAQLNAATDRTNFRIAHGAARSRVCPTNQKVLQPGPTAASAPAPASASTPCPIASSRS